MLSCCKELQRNRQCFPALKIKSCFCFHYLTWMFLLNFKSTASLHLAATPPQRGDWSMIYKSLILWLRYVELCWGSSSTSSDLRECRPQLCPPFLCEKESGDNTSLWPALLLPLLQKQNLPADLTGRWWFSVRSLHFFHTKAVVFRVRSSKTFWLSHGIKITTWRNMSGSHLLNARPAPPRLWDI